MSRVSQYRRWSGTVIGAVIMTLTVTPVRVQSQVQPDGPAIERQIPDAPDQPAASDNAPAAAGRKQAGAEAGPQDSPRRRQAAEEFDDPFTTLDMKAKDEAPHPLAAAYPNHHVIVCVAGCGAQTPAIVYIAPRDSTTERTSAVQPAALALVSAPSTPITVASATNRIECIAGCYDRRQ